MLAISKERSSTGRSFHADVPTAEKALRCTVAKWARGSKSSPLAAERSTRRAAKPDTLTHINNMIIYNSVFASCATWAHWAGILFVVDVNETRWPISISRTLLTLLTILY